MFILCDSMFERRQWPDLNVCLHQATLFHGSLYHLPLQASVAHLSGIVAVFFCGLVRVERVPRYFPAAWLYIMILTGTVAVFFCGLVRVKRVPW
jgi:hypothetical protein